LPAGLRAPFSALRSDAEEAARAATPYVTPTRKSTSPNVPALILIAVLGLGGLLWGGVRHARESAQTSIYQGISTIVGTSGTTGGMITRTLPGNVNLQFAPGGIEDALSSYLASPIKGSAAFEFNHIVFNPGS